MNELQKIEEKLTQDYKSYLEFGNNCSSKSPRIIFGERDIDFWETKLHVKYYDNEEISLDKIHIDLLDLYSRSKLSDKENGQIVISGFIITPLLYNDVENKPERGIIVSLKYIYDGINKYKKEEEIKIRISPTLKKDFQDICEAEETTMSNKINSFIVKEVKNKKVKVFKGQTLTKQLIRFGVMNGNGRLYTKEELTRVRFDKDGLEYTELERLNKQPLYGQFGYYPDGEVVHKYNATHSISNIRIKEDWLEGDVTILNDSITPILDNLVFRPRSFGILDEKNVVQDLEIIGFDDITKSEDKFI